MCRSDNLETTNFACRVICADWARRLHLCGAYLGPTPTWLCKSPSNKCGHCKRRSDFTLMTNQDLKTMCGDHGCMVETNRMQVRGKTLCQQGTTSTASLLYVALTYKPKHTQIQMKKEEITGWDETNQSPTKDVHMQLCSKFKKLCFGGSKVKVKYGILLMVWMKIVFVNVNLDVASLHIQVCACRLNVLSLNIQVSTC